VSSTETLGGNIQFSVDDVDVLAPPPPSSK
jgi:hypothetical protein